MDLEIFVMDANGHNQTPLTNNDLDDFAPSFSPNGQRIVFSHYDGTDDDIAVMDADGQNQTPLTDLPSDQFAPAFSPDGQRIVFVSEIPPTGNAIVTMDADGQNQVPLTGGFDFDRQPDWQPLNPPACDVAGDAKQKSTKRVTVTVNVVAQNEDASLVVGGSLKVTEAQGCGLEVEDAGAPAGERSRPTQCGHGGRDHARQGRARSCSRRPSRRAGSRRGRSRRHATDDLGATSSASWASSTRSASRRSRLGRPSVAVRTGEDV